MITNKIVGIAILMVCVVLPFIVFLLVEIVEAIKDVIKYGDFVKLFLVFWLIMVIVGFGLLYI